MNLPKDPNAHAYFSRTLQAFALVSDKRKGKWYLLFIRIGRETKRILRLEVLGRSNSPPVNRNATKIPNLTPCNNRQN